MWTSRVAEEDQAAAEEEEGGGARTGERGTRSGGGRGRAGTIWRRKRVDAGRGRAADGTMLR